MATSSEIMKVTSVQENVDIHNKGAVIPELWVDVLTWSPGPLSLFSSLSLETIFFSCSGGDDDTEYLSTNFLSTYFALIYASFSCLVYIKMSSYDDTFIIIIISTAINN